MKKIIAVLIAGTFIIGTAVAQTPESKPAAKKEAAAPAQKKDEMGTPKPDKMKKHHKGGKKHNKKAETAAPEKK